MKDEIRDSIIKVSGEIFSRFGFNKTTMDDIARGMRKGKSSIYYYFRNKEEIFQEVVEKEVSMLRSRILTEVEKQDNPKDKIRAYVKVRMDGFANLLNLYSLLKTEYLAHYDFVEEIRKNYDKAEISIIKEILDEGVQKTIFTLDDPYLTAVTLVTAMKGFEIPLYIKPSEENHLEMRLDNLLNTFFFGIIKR
ncbi:MAG: TetR/AcrR family transcriptional regulator [Bacteroidales bacterium]|nr:TetR/AcrR family transcriptional regulator [Bacteroidales bacterium]